MNQPSAATVATVTRWAVAAAGGPAPGGRCAAQVIADKRIQPPDPEQSHQLATQAIRRDAVSDIAKKQVKQARDLAKIEYQAGFTPAGGTPKS